MDPQACLQRIIDAYYLGYWHELGDSLEDLWNWMDRGGFAPVVDPSQMPAFHRICQGIYAIQLVDGGNGYEIVKYLKSIVPSFMAYKLEMKV